MLYTIDDIRARVVPIAQRYNLPVVYLFGSYARGEADEASDIDLAFEEGERISELVWYGSCGRRQKLI